MKHLLWLIVIFVLVPISMIVSEVRANTDKEFFIPQEIVDKYIRNSNPDLVLVPLRRWTHFKERQIVFLPFITREHMDKCQRGEFVQNFKTRAIAVFCVKKNCFDVFETGTRLMAFSVLIDDKWEQVYANKHEHTGEVRRL